MLVDPESGEIFIYAPIGEDFWGDGITAEAVVLALDSMGGKRVTVRLNSPGGVADEGVAIYNALRRYRGGVDTIVDALAASAASIIALAGENRSTATGARWMIHRAMGVGIGNRMEMEKVVDMLGKYDESIAEIYSEHMPDKSRDEIMDMLTAETWFTGDEAIEIGLSTGKERTEAGTPNVANWFKNAPEAIYREAVKNTAKPKVPVNRQAASIRMRK